MKIELKPEDRNDPKVAQLLAALNRALDDLNTYGVKVTGPQVVEQKWQRAG